MSNDTMTKSYAKTATAIQKKFGTNEKSEPVSLKGLDKREGFAVLDDLTQHCLQPQGRGGAVTQLATMIQRDGLREPIACLPNFTILKGHLRTAALKLYRRNAPQAFAEMFSEGIPVVMYHDLTDAQERELVHDHSDQRMLRSVVELYSVVKLRVGGPQTNAQIAFELRNSFDALYTRSDGREARLKEIEKELDKCEDVQEREKLQKDLIKEYGAYRNGDIQKLTAVARLPLEVEHYMIKQWDGKEVPVKLSFQPLRKLISDFKALMQEQPNSSRFMPPMGWDAIWRAAITPTEPKKKETKKTTPSGEALNLSRKQVQERLEAPQSAIVAAICNILLNGEYKDLMALDCALAETKLPRFKMADKSEQKQG